ncbi:MAG: preprotein translocase subunit YajC [Gammaproteobacteria bacterium]|nr:preprotein translocase subunit YajC [Gammaproteobacteria bacterium]MDE0094184.1 preprotein translocase subunit YajC [Gammaproteobacteria bacterium]MDE0251778.1 preprotein translocase subunit YajC [Gammaproteobacteria bacterium]MDE0403213.1 preprotein translocase subunit YajC [Gammaproteobacteria bacterium]MXX95118.1 preprotein translocase subunit YajC [Gammaproteobacteria bacterium]
MNFLEATAYAAASGAGGEGGGNIFFTLLMIGGFILIFYFLLIRPQSKQRKQHQELIAAIGRGDEVVMAGGIMGIITKVDENSVNVKVAKNTELHFQKQAVQATLPKGTVQNLNG